MSAPVLLNLIKDLRKRDKIRGLPSILSVIRNTFIKLNKIGVRMLDSIYRMNPKPLYIFASKCKYFDI